MTTISENIKLLESPRSPKRRAAAKKLRKLGDVNAGSALLTALRKEVEDPRTWETQYQLVMALGECRYVESLPFLREFAAKPLEATMIYVGLGDSIVRLCVESPNDGLPVIELMESENSMLVDGAFRAMAMLRLVPSPEHIDQILQFLSTRPAEDGIRFWALAAAPDWTGESVERFINECSSSSVEQIANAAELAARRIYKKWNPL